MTIHRKEEFWGGNPVKQEIVLEGVKTNKGTWWQSPARALFFLLNIFCCIISHNNKKIQSTQFSNVRA